MPPLRKKKNEKEAAFPVTDTLLDTHEKKWVAKKIASLAKFYNNQTCNWFFQSIPKWLQLDWVIFN